MEISHLYSFSKLKQAFGIKTLDDVIPVTISIDPNKYIPSGSPGVVNKNTLLNIGCPEGKLVSVLFQFPPKAGVTPGTCIKIHSKNIYQFPQKKLIVGHKVKTIDMFNVKKLRKIGDFVKDNAAITFALSNTTSASEFFANIPNICSEYKYSTFFYHHGEGLSGHIRSADDVFVSFVSFIDINYCIPIFDHRKVDGMGVYCGFMYNNKDGKGSVLIDMLCFVVSNHRENLFYTDGAKVASESKISVDILKYMIQNIKLKSKCKIEKKVIGKKKKAKSDGIIYVNTAEKLESYENVKYSEKAVNPDHVVKYSAPTSVNSSSDTSSNTYTISGSWS